MRLTPNTAFVCAQCDRPVELVETWRDILSARTYFRFQCHGDVEQVVLEDFIFEDGRYRLGYCFAKPVVAELPARNETQALP